ncbi:ABC transporter substrate-binding protein [Labrys neptuniae]
MHHRVLTGRLTLSCVVAALTLAAASAQAQQTTLTIAGYGGNLQSDLRKTLWQPAADKAGVALREETHEDLAAVRVQVQSGKPGWDVVHFGGDDCSVGAKEGLFEKIDYNVVDTKGISPSAYGDGWVATNTYSVVLAWRKDKYKDNPPKNWKDFWNVSAFPGRRALSVFPAEMMEITLLGDGVAPDKLYPLDTDRAFKALNRIKPNITVWWASGAQSAQLLKDGEVDMAAIWGSRVMNVIKDGAPVDFTYQDAVIGYGCLAIVKGSANVAAAQKFIANVVSPEIQARIPTMMNYYGPSNERAFEVAKFPPEVLAKSNMSPENRAKQVPIDVAWWRDHNKEVLEDYNVLRSQ